MALDTRTSGALGGAAQGAAIGTKILPGWGTAIGAVAGGLLGGLTGGSDSKAKRLAKMQAELIRRTAQENQRRAELEMNQVLGLGRASIAAGNLLETGSSRNYMNQLRSQFQQDITWDLLRSRMEEKAARMGGQITASQIRASGTASMVGGLISAAPTLLGTIFPPTPKTPQQE